MKRRTSFNAEHDDEDSDGDVDARGRRRASTHIFKERTRVAVKPRLMKGSQTQPQVEERREDTHRTTNPSPPDP